jgi:hypothetical protein
MTDPRNDDALPVGHGHAGVRPAQRERLAAAGGRW